MMGKKKANGIGLRPKLRCTTHNLYGSISPRPGSVLSYVVCVSGQHRWLSHRDQNNPSSRRRRPKQTTCRASVVHRVYCLKRKRGPQYMEYSEHPEVPTSIALRQKYTQECYKTADVPCATTTRRQHCNTVLHCLYAQYPERTPLVFLRFHTTSRRGCEHENAEGIQRDQVRVQVGHTTV